MFRGGGSEYTINGTACRLLDVQELLSDSGIGREMHVIVGQGQLDAVLRATPEERRGFIEEAAGVLKHRKRKEKALRKLEAMQANLTRVSDLTAEIRRQLGPLGRQAEVARKAVVVQTDLRDARLRLLADDLAQLTSTLEAEVADETALRERRAEVEQALGEARGRLARLEEAAQAEAPLVARTQETWYRLSSLRERLRSTEGVARERLRLLASETDDTAQSGRDPEQLAAQAARVREEERALAEQIAGHREALTRAVEHRQQVEQALADAQKRLATALRAAADRREGLARLSGQVQARRSRIEAAEAEVGRLAETLEEALARGAEAEQEFTALESQVAGVERGEEGLDAEHEQASAAPRGRRGRGRAAARGGAGGRARARHLDRPPRGARAGPGPQGRRRRAAGGRRPRERCARVGRDAAHGGVRLRDRGRRGARGRRRRRGRRLPRRRRRRAAHAALAGRRPGGPRRRRRPGAAGRPRSLAAAARGRPLGARAGAGARRRAPGHRPPADPRGRRPRPSTTPARSCTRCPTAPPSPPRATCWLRAWCAVARPAPRACWRCRRPPTRPSDAAAAATRRVEQTRFALAAAERAAAEALERVEAALERLHESDAQHAAVAERLGHLGAAVRSAHAEADRVRKASESAEAALEADRATLSELEQRLAAAEDEPDEVGEPSTDERDRLDEEAATARAGETEARLALRTGEERVRALTARAESLERAVREEQQARERAAARRARRQREAEVAHAVQVAAEFTHELLTSSLEQATAERDAAQATRSQREAELNAVRAELRELEDALRELTDSVHKDEVARTQQRLRIESLQAKAVEELGVEPDVLMEEFGPHQLVPPSPAVPGDPEPETPPEPRPYVREEQEKRLRKAERALSLLGRVNPLALEEYAALEERHKFLTAQLADLGRSRTDLMDIVKEVDERVEQVFTAAYHDTAAQFEGVFSRLFPGGEGRLVLTDPSDMLTTGIEVEARPPGKKVKRLSLLSGGERSLTAVALLVAIFKARPSPFYVMDEVEAALDDTNLGRLIQIMEELRESSQLIVITHQKRTMEVADALYGVTMRGDGVTTVVSQRLREASSA